MFFESDYEGLQVKNVKSALEGDPRLVMLDLQELQQTPVAKLAAKYGLVASNCVSTLDLDLNLNLTVFSRCKKSRRISWTLSQQSGGCRSPVHHSNVEPDRQAHCNPPSREREIVSNSSEIEAPQQSKLEVKMLRNIFLCSPDQSAYSSTLLSCSVNQYEWNCIVCVQPNMTRGSRSSQSRGNPSRQGDRDSRGRVAHLKRNSMTYGTPSRKGRRQITKMRCLRP